VTEPVVAEVSVVVLLDRTGRVLMQHRDQYAPIDPERWGMPGGHLEPGEDPLTAAHRELLEETGLTADLALVGVIDRAPAGDGYAARMHVFTGRTDATQEDVVLGEGQAMVFLTRDEIASLAKSRTAQQCLDLALQ
jgi:8-oxo-dGTP pyrophosphatase MutT (NUDIX family)